jgi:hypothetical protein
VTGVVSAVWVLLLAALLLLCCCYHGSVSCVAPAISSPAAAAAAAGGGNSMAGSISDTFRRCYAADIIMASCAEAGSNTRSEHPANAVGRDSLHLFDNCERCAACVVFAFSFCASWHPRLTPTCTTTCTYERHQRTGLEAGRHGEGSRLDGHSGGGGRKLGWGGVGWGGVGWGGVGWGGVGWGGVGWGGVGWGGVGRP